MTILFSLFPNASTENANDSHGTFGKETTNAWQPWKYSTRLNVVKSVEALNANLPKQKFSDATKI